MNDFFIDKFGLMILKSITDTLVVTDIHLNICFYNGDSEDLFEYTANELKGQPIQILFHHAEWEKILHFTYNTDQSKRLKDQLTCISKCGEKISMEVNVNLLKEDQCEIRGYVFTFRDASGIKRLNNQLAHSIREMEFANREIMGVNTELENEINLRKKIEEELRQQKILLEKLNVELENRVMAEVKANREKDRQMLIQSRQASMGAILESVAHQWKQPLNTINLMLFEIEKLAHDYTSEFTFKELKSKILEINGVIMFMAQTIDDFRNFFIPGREIKEFRLADAILKTSEFLAAEYKHSGINLEFKLDEKLIISGYQNEFMQVIMNILNNARDAFQEFATGTPNVRIVLERKEMVASIEIENNAGAIPENLLNEIFDAYTTTKHNGKGTGLGLYIAKSIIEKKFNGTICAKNTQTGAIFNIQLPLQ